MSLKESVTLDEVLEVLNGAIKDDPAAMKSLVETRVECNEKLADHPTIKVSSVGDYHEAKDGIGRYAVGFLGILNGLFGVDEKGWGAIAAQFEVACPDSCAGGPMPIELKAGDPCPSCGKSLVIGNLILFVRANQPKISDDVLETHKKFQIGATEEITDGEKNKDLE